MAERDLDAMLRRMSQTKVNRRSFLGSRRPDRRRRGPRGLLRRRDDQRRAECGSVCRGIERSVRRCPVRSVELRRRRTARKRAVHVQLEPVHRPGQQQGVPGRVRRRHVPVRHLREQRGAARQARGRRRRLRHRVADGRVPAGHGRGGLPPEARPVAGSRTSSTSTRRSRSCGGIRPTNTTSRRTRGRPASCTAGSWSRIRRRRGPSSTTTSRARHPARRSSSTRWAT